MKRILVIGIGSLIMKDDGIGSRVVEALAPSLLELDIASFVGETDFQACFDAISPYELVIIVDAMASGKEPGSIEVMPLSDALKERARLRAPHDLSLLDLIALHAKRIQGYFIGIEAAESGFGFELSAPLQARFEQICADVLRAVKNIQEAAEKCMIRT